LIDDFVHRPIVLIIRAVARIILGLFAVGFIIAVGLMIAV
jgi:hypothetical protein